MALERHRLTALLLLLFVAAAVLDDDEGPKEADEDSSWGLEEELLRLEKSEDASSPPESDESDEWETRRRVLQQGFSVSAVAGFVSSKDSPDDSPLIEPVWLSVQKGNPTAMYKIGVFYYHLGLRGVRRDHAKALSWFLKAVEKGESMPLEFLGEIYARGFGVERNYIKAFDDYFKKALHEKQYSGYDGIGYLYLIGQGVDKQNLTKAKEFYKKAADHNDPNGYYNLGVKVAGVKKNIRMASRYLVAAANPDHPKAYHQLAKTLKGIGMRKNLTTAAELYKAVAERGPWGSLLRCALESYLKGYELGQSSAAWILEGAICIGKSGFCTESERHQRAYALWSEQVSCSAHGSSHITGRRATETELEGAAEAYLRQHNAIATATIIESNRL